MQAPSFVSSENATFLWFYTALRLRPALPASAPALDAFRRPDYRSATFSPYMSRARRRRRRGLTGISIMAWRCELTGKTRQIGHRVSHSNRKTKRRFLPNLLNVTLLSDSLGRSLTFADFGQCAEERRSPRRARCLSAQGQGRRAFAARA